MKYFVVAFVFLIGSCLAARKNGRIAGGSPAQIEQFPFIVQVEIYEWTYWEKWCGGSIISNFYILSAASCFLWVDIARHGVRIRAGSEIRETGGDVYEASSILDHPDFIYDVYPHDMDSMDNNISLIRLRSPLVFSDKVQNIAIVQSNFVVPDNAPVTYAGWGAVKDGQHQESELLLHVNVTTVNWDICAEAYANAEFPENITENMICAGSPGKGACLGDFGGPLIYGGVLVGVISFNNGYCPLDGYPEVSTRVASYTDWILKNAV